MIEVVRFRIDAAGRADLEAACKRLGLSKSALLRLAVRQLAQVESVVVNMTAPTLPPPPALAAGLGAQ